MRYLLLLILFVGCNPVKQVLRDQEKLEQVENQIGFYSDSIKTIDAVLFGIKTRLDVQKLLDGH